MNIFIRDKLIIYINKQYNTNINIHILGFENKLIMAYTIPSLCSSN